MLPSYSWVNLLVRVSMLIALQPLLSELWINPVVSQHDSPACLPGWTPHQIKLSLLPTSPLLPTPPLSSPPHPVMFISLVFHGFSPTTTHAPRTTLTLTHTQTLTSIHTNLKTDSTVHLWLMIGNLSVWSLDFGWLVVFIVLEIWESSVVSFRSTHYLLHWLSPVLHCDSLCSVSLTCFWMRAVFCL